MLSQRRDQGDGLRPIYEMGEPSASFFFFFVKSESKLKTSDRENHCTCLWLFKKKKVNEVNTDLKSLNEIQTTFFYLQH